MLGSNTGRLRKLAGLACAGLLAAAIAACAASTTVQTSAPESGSIADVRVERDGDATMVTLLGLEEPIFTAFSQENPERVVVDLASVRPEEISDPLAVYDGLVEEVALSPFSTGTGEPMTRVEVSLAMAADFQVLPSDEGLVIRVEPMPGMMEGSLLEEPFEEDPWAAVPAVADDSLEAPATSEPMPPATKLTAVETRETAEGAIVHLRTDGEVTSAESFTLDNPARLVVDLPGLTSDLEQARIEFGSPQAERVRIGQHAEMVRIVIDAGSAPAPFQGRRVVPASGGLLIALGSGEELDWAVNEMLGSARPMLAEAPMPGDEQPEAEEPASELAEADAEAEPEAAPTAELAEMEPPAELEEPEPGEMEPEAAPMAELAEVEEPAEAQEPEAAPIAEVQEPEPAGPVTIYGIEYDAQDERDRVVVLGERPVDYLLYEPSADTVVLSIQNAVIDPEVAVRITPDAGGPVSLVTAFEQPETEGSEVRVVIMRAENLKPEISRRGALIVLDFPRDGSVAASPPVLAAVEPGATPTAEPQAPASAAPAPAVVPAAPAPAVPASAPAAAAPASLEPAASIEILQEGGLMDGKEYTGRRISLDFKDIEMADVLRLIAEVSDLNVIAGDEVAGRVTIRMVDVPWDQALDVILLTKGLGFMRVGNVLRIAPADVLSQEEEMRLQERRALEQLEDLVVKLQPVNYADAKRVKGTVQRLLSARGTVDVDARTNTLIIKDIPSVIDEATALIKAIDTQTPQVLIESKIVEASLDFSREFGVVWGLGAQPLSDAWDTSSSQRQDLGSDAFRLHNSDGSSFAGNNAQFFNPLTANPTALFNIAGFLLDEKLNLELQLQAAEVNGDGKVISSPRVVTLNNNKASIEQGVSIPFQTFENGDAQLEFVDAVLKLDVTPHITADKSIIMEIKVSRNAPDDSVFTLTGSPAIAKNQVDTETLVKDGQTLVLGGIYVVQKGQRQSRVPYLHSIPLIGSLFRSDEIRDTRKELLIFVTPRIVAVQPAAI
jgi:type IV pilus assembly protein PilQ